MGPLRGPVATPVLGGFHPIRSTLTVMSTCQNKQAVMTSCRLACTLQYVAPHKSATRLKPCYVAAHQTSHRLSGSTSQPVSGSTTNPMVSVGNVKWKVKGRLKFLVLEG